MFVLRLLKIFFLFGTLKYILLFILIGSLIISVYEWFDIHYSYTPIKSKNVKVIDGDTISIDSTKVRLKGIDAPELKQKCKQHNNAYISCGTYAKIKLLSLIENNTVYCSLSGTDRYNRRLSYCYANSKNLSLELVRTGYAYSYRHQNIVLNIYELLARYNRRGLWSYEFQQPWEWRKSKNKKYLYNYMRNNFNIPDIAN